MQNRSDSDIPTFSRSSRQRRHGFAIRRFFAGNPMSMSDSRKDEEQIERLDSLIDWAHRNDIEFHVTENKVWLKDGNDDNLEAQADTYVAIIRALVSRSDTGVVTGNDWQVRDPETQNGEWKDCLFDEEGILRHPARADVYAKTLSLPARSRSLLQSLRKAWNLDFFSAFWAKAEN